MLVPLFSGCSMLTPSVPPISSSLSDLGGGWNDIKFFMMLILHVHSGVLTNRMSSHEKRIKRSMFVLVWTTVHRTLCQQSNNFRTCLAEGVFRGHSVLKMLVSQLLMGMTHADFET